MKKCIAIIVVCLLCSSILAAGPFGLFGGRRAAPSNCGPNGCSVPPALVLGPSSPVLQPIPEPVPAPVEQPAKDFGVNLEKVSKTTRITTNSGREIGIREASGIIGGEIPDDSKKLRYVVIGTPEQRRAAEEAYQKMEFKDRLAPWFVSADHFSLKDTVTGKPIFVTSGTPTVYLQAPDGKPLLRSDEWKGDFTVDAIRKATKDYDSGKDPNPNKPAPAPVLPSNIPWIPLGIAAAVLFFLYQHNKEKKS